MQHSIFENVRFLNEADTNRTVTIQLFGKAYTVPVVFDIYPGEEVTQEQEKNLKTFLKTKDYINNEEEIYKSLEHISLIIADEIGYNKKLNRDTIISLINKPNSIYVVRKSNIVCIMCNDYKLDPEHGLAILFKDGKFSTVTSQDAVL